MQTLPGANSSRVAQVGGSEMNVAGADEDVYYVTVNVGTPPQPFRVKLDTSSYDLVLPSGVAADAGPSACTTCHAKRHPVRCHPCFVELGVS
ncbi:MAG: hypothetical protein CMJ54_06420 [Planctomycetaceae bacterium]|nr:hypothetical protein [Planctomycetaceae bacterium]